MIWPSILKFDRQSSLAFAITSLALVLSLAAFPLTGMLLDAPQLWWMIALGTPLIGFAGIIRAYGRKNIAPMIEMLGTAMLGRLKLRASSISDALAKWTNRGLITSDHR